MSSPCLCDTVRTVIPCDGAQLTLALLLERTLCGMARLEALLLFLRGTAVVVRLRSDGSHVVAAAT